MSRKFGAAKQKKYYGLVKLDLESICSLLGGTTQLQTHILKSHHTTDRIDGAYVHQFVALVLLHAWDEKVWDGSPKPFPLESLMLGIQNTILDLHVHPKLNDRLLKRCSPNLLLDPSRWSKMVQPNTFYQNLPCWTYIIPF